MNACTRHTLALGFTIACLAGPAAADVKIAFIDPLSGGGAATGILAQKTHQFYIDAINAAGGLNGEKIELLSYDNKVNPQESLIQLKRALNLPFASPNAFVHIQAELPEARLVMTIAQDHHRCVVQAIENREGSRAEALMREHSRIAQRNLREALHGVQNHPLPGVQLIRRRA